MSSAAIQLERGSILGAERPDTVAARRVNGEMGARVCSMRIGEQPDSVDSGRRFEAMVVPYLKEGYRLARSLMRKDQDADDVLQEASLRAYRFVGMCRAENPRAWFLIIVRNTAYSWLRRCRQQQRLVSLDGADGPACLDNLADPETPESILLAEEAKHRRRQVARGLSAAHREILALREDQELSYSEIAELIGIPTGTVMSRLARARAALDRRHQVDLSMCCATE